MIGIDIVDSLFSRMYMSITRGLGLNVRGRFTCKSFLTQRVVGAWNVLPREVVTDMIGMFKKHFDKHVNRHLGTCTGMEGCKPCAGRWD